jgi:hypothetical protein
MKLPAFIVRTSALRRPVNTNVKIIARSLKTGGIRNYFQKLMYLVSLKIYIFDHMKMSAIMWLLVADE